MQSKEYSDRFQSTAAATMRLVEGSQWSGDDEDHYLARQEKKKEYYMADSWFASATVASNMAHLGHEFFGPVSCISLIYFNMIILTLLFIIECPDRSAPTNDLYLWRR